jgi:hypothetical protein
MDQSSINSKSNNPQSSDVFSITNSKLTQTDRTTEYIKALAELLYEMYSYEVEEIEHSEIGYDK